MTQPLSELPIDNTLEGGAWLVEAQRLIRERDAEMYEPSSAIPTEAHSKGAAE